MFWLSTCSWQYGDSSDLTMTFLKREAHLRYPAFEDQRSINVSVEFRTYEESGVLIYHKFSTTGYFKVRTSLGFTFALTFCAVSCLRKLLLFYFYFSLIFINLSFWTQDWFGATYV